MREGDELAVVGLERGPGGFTEGSCIGRQPVSIGNHIERGND
jgi:hypothetical protein